MNSRFTNWRKIPEAVELREEVVRFMMEGLGSVQSRYV